MLGQKGAPSFPLWKKKTPSILTVLSGWKNKRMLLLHRGDHLHGGGGISECENNRATPSPRSSQNYHCLLESILPSSQAPTPLIKHLLLQDQEWLLEQGQHRPEAAAWCRGCFSATSHSPCGAVVMGPAGLSAPATFPQVPLSLLRRCRHYLSMDLLSEVQQEQSKEGSVGVWDQYPQPAASGGDCESLFSGLKRTPSDGAVWGKRWG